MRTYNKLLFDNLDTDYAKDFDTINKFGFRRLESYKDIIGFDHATNGWVAVHRHHAVSGLFDELPTCRILKNKGYRVLLIEESTEILSADAFINDELHEMKRVSSATNLPRAIEKQLRLAYKKSENIALHIDQPITTEILVASLRKAAFNHVGIKNVLLIWEDKVKLLTRQEILDSVWHNDS